MFLGFPSPGRLVWVLPKQTRLIMQHDYQTRLHKLRKRLLGIEQCLVSLSILLANELAALITSNLVIPADNVLPDVGREHFNSAVIEILGPEWFDLPFDDEGRLRDWAENRQSFLGELDSLLFYEMEYE